MIAIVSFIFFAGNDKSVTQMIIAASTMSVFGLGAWISHQLQIYYRLKDQKRVHRRPSNVHSTK